MVTDGFKEREGLLVGVFDFSEDRAEEICDAERIFRVGEGSMAS